jgi:uncharacterized protein YjbJ (UPF0337 family)
LPAPLCEWIGLATEALEGPVNASFPSMKVSIGRAMVGQRTDCGRRHHYLGTIRCLDELIAKRRRRYKPLPGGIMMNKNQVKGRKNKIVGKIKEVVGKVTGNKTMEYKGKAEKLGGKTQAGYGDLSNDIKETESKTK